MNTDIENIPIWRVKLTKKINAINLWRIQKIPNSTFLIIAAAFVGLIGGIAASVLKSLTHSIELFLQDGFKWQYKYYLYFAFPLIGILLSVIYVKTFLRKKRFEHGLGQILFSISRSKSRIQVHNVYSQIFTSALTVGFGGSAGLEAPIATSGSAIGSNIGRLLGLNYRETTLLLACGAAAGISGAFNSPVAGVVFSLEILLPQFSVPAFIPLLIAAAIAAVVSHILNPHPLFVLVTEGWVLEALHFYILMAIGIGFFSVYFSKVNFYVSNKLSNIKNAYQKAIVSGLLLGGMIAVMPALYGEGYVTIQHLMNGDYKTIANNSFFSSFSNEKWFIIAFAIITLFGKSIAALVTVNSGGNGGTFGPSLVMGGLFGFIFAFSVNAAGIAHLNITNFIVVGMAAALSGIMHAPLTGMFLIAEITGGYSLMIPLMLVAAIAYSINRYFVKHSIYTKKLAEKGDLMNLENRDRTLFQMMKIKYLIEKDYVSLLPDETPKQRANDIIHHHKNLYAVVDSNNALLGTVPGESLLEHIITEEKEPAITMLQLCQPAEYTISLYTPVFSVIQLMDEKNITTIPVVDSNKILCGFVTRQGIMDKYRNLMKRNTNYIN